MVNQDRNSRGERCLRIWKVLLGQALVRNRITYSELASYADIPQVMLRSSGQGTLLARVNAYCDRNSLPPLAVLVVRIDTKEPGAGYLGNVAEDTREAFKFDWFSVSYPTADSFL